VEKRRKDTEKIIFSI